MPAISYLSLLALKLTGKEGGVSRVDDMLLIDSAAVSTDAVTPVRGVNAPTNDEGPAAVDACGAFIVCLNQSGRGGS